MTLYLHLCLFNDQFNVSCRAFSLILPKIKIAIPAAMALKISETEVLAKFDRLVQKGELHYAPPNRHHITEDKFQVRFRLFLLSSLYRTHSSVC